MILDSIVLNNFGAYRGHQEAVLTPEDGKPIILFGGMNGGGKTTLLDAVQLAFYGPKARLSNRGRLGYREYLSESIHRGSAPEEGAGIAVRFRRTIGGEIHRFELQRRWSNGSKGIEETVCVMRDGVPDDSLADHWDETIESYLPSSIAHLFFFDGEQIKDLAEGHHTKEILGTAIHSLLGLDLVDRLETDLKVFERRKKSEGLDRETAQKLAQAREELQHIDNEQEKIAIEEGRLFNEVGQLNKELLRIEDTFRSEGGELYLRREEMKNEFDQIKARQKELESQLRELAAGPLPLHLVEGLLSEVEDVARHETEIRRARVLRDVLEVRDAEIIALLEKTQDIGVEALRKIAQVLEVDRYGRGGLAEEALVLDTEDNLPMQLAYLRAAVLPAAGLHAKEILAELASLEEESTRLEGELVRVPTAERIAVVQKELDKIRTAHDAKLAERDSLRIRKQALQRQREAAESRVDRLSEDDMNIRFAEDERQRMLKHSMRVRETLGLFRSRVIKRHTTSMESLMLESFRQLLRKTNFISGLTINPNTFETTLIGRNRETLSFDRLSSGEKQLLATSMLWGLARASGRPVPTIIDTPLGRLDSSHRRHLTERYFPNAAHQVLLLSTDEEIIGPYYAALKPFITRSYLLAFNEESERTNIEPGYFNR